MIYKISDKVNLYDVPAIGV